MNTGEQYDLADIDTRVKKIIEEYIIPKAQHLSQSSRDHQAMIIALEGDLGAGKTTFVQAIAKYFGVTETVTSPSFVVMKQYNMNHSFWNTFVHMDAYRIEHDQELHPLGFDEMINNTHAFVCIEWPSRIASLKPDITIQLSHEENSNEQHHNKRYISIA